MQQREPVRRDPPGRHRRSDRAARLLVMAAIAEAAVAEKRPHLDERFGDARGLEVGEAERLHPGRVDDPRVVPTSGSGYSVVDVVVWRPACSASEISVVRTAGVRHAAH